MQIQSKVNYVNVLKTYVTTKIELSLLTFHGLRIPVKKFGNSSGSTTASFSNFFASSSSAMSFLKKIKICKNLKKSQFN